MHLCIVSVGIGTAAKYISLWDSCSAVLILFSAMVSTVPHTVPLSYSYSILATPNMYCIKKSCGAVASVLQVYCDLALWHALLQHI